MNLKGRVAYACLALSIVTTVATATPTASTVAARTIRIDNFGRVDASYFRGAQPQGHDYTDLAALGVKTIIDLTSDDGAADEPLRSEMAGLKYVHIPMTTHQPPTAAQLAQFLAVVNDPTSEPVYVHCVGGRHRTGVMTAIYRITQDGWSTDQAFAEMKQYKFGADFLHPEFKAFVYQFRAPVNASTVVATTKAAD